MDQRATTGDERGAQQAEVEPDGEGVAGGDVEAGNGDRGLAAGSDFLSRDEERDAANALATDVAEHEGRVQIDDQSAAARRGARVAGIDGGESDGRVGGELDFERTGEIEILGEEGCRQEEEG